MAPSLTLNLPLEDYVPLLAVIGTGALAIVLRNRGRARQADAEAVELEETGAAARGTTPGAPQHAVPSSTTVVAIDTAVATPLRAVDNVVAGGAAIDTAVTGGAAVDAIDNEVTTPLSAVDNVVAGGTRLDTIDNAIGTSLRAVDNAVDPEAIATEVTGALVNSVTVDAPDVVDASD